MQPPYGEAPYAHGARFPRLAMWEGNCLHTLLVWSSRSVCMNQDAGLDGHLAKSSRAYVFTGQLPKEFPWLQVKIGHFPPPVEASNNTASQTALGFLPLFTSVRGLWRKGKWAEIGTGNFAFTHGRIPSKEFMKLCCHDNFRFSTSMSTSRMSLKQCIVSLLSSLQLRPQPSPSLLLNTIPVISNPLWRLPHSLNLKEWLFLKKKTQAF